MAVRTSAVAPVRSPRPGCGIANNEDLETLPQEVAECDSTHTFANMPPSTTLL
jgi:hypothetical protein